MKKQGALSRNIRILPTRIGHARWWRRLWWEQVTLRQFLKREKVDVLFSSANFGMFRCPVPQLLLLQNALYFSGMYQQMFLAKHRLRAKTAFWLRRWLIQQSVRNADVVMTPTRAMLDELRAFVEVSPEKAQVNPYEVYSPELLPSGVTRTTEGTHGDRAVRLIYISLYSEHKNLSTLLKALPLLNRNGTRRFVLRTTADPTWDAAGWTATQKEDLALANQREVAQWVEFVGPLDWQQTQDLYQDTDIFVFPSLIESFGYPMAEAMAYGLPIVAADTPVNREIGGESALYFSPLSPEELAGQVQRLAADDALGLRLSAAARLRAETQFPSGQHVRRFLKTAASLRTHPRALAS